jgi:YVTN family beta-propeller protein
MRLLALLACLLPVCAQADGAFAPPRVVKLGPPERFQYVVFDPASHRVFVAHGSEVTVVDTGKLSVAGHATGLSSAHGIALVPGGHLYADSGRAANVTVFDPTSLRGLATLKADTDAYAVVYDPASRHVFVMNDDAGTITVIDPAGDHVIDTISVGPGLESAEADGEGHLFIAHSEARQVLRIDTRRNIADARWSVAACGEPHGLAIDNVRHLIFVSCPEGRMVALDALAGRLIASLPIGGGSDCLIFDARRRRIYSPNAIGTLSIIDELSADTFVRRPDLPTRPGARTGALDPATGRLFLVTAEVAGSEPPKSPGLPPRYRFLPGSTELLVIDPPP